MPKPNLQLIPLFNEGFDFAKYDRVAERYYGCNKKRATHRLRCTRWNSGLKHTQDIKARLRASRMRPEGWALAVCAIPMKRRKDRKPGLRLKRPIPPEDERIVYKKRGTLEGKRLILITMTQTHATPTKMRKLILKMSNAKCDTLYRTLLIANKVARRRAARAARRALRKARKSL